MSHSKLKLNRETLRSLDQTSYRTVVGGLTPETGRGCQSLACTEVDCYTVACPTVNCGSM